jgi:hypothetical protein
VTRADADAIGQLVLNDVFTNKSLAERISDAVWEAYQKGGRDNAPVLTYPTGYVRSREERARREKEGDG